MLRLYDLNVNNVPRLPVPEVEHTMTRFLETMRPLLTDAEYERTVQQTKAFVQSAEAKKLQAQVLKKANGTTWPYNYFDDSWTEGYYSSQYKDYPLMINYNPCFSFHNTQAAGAPELALGAKYASSLVKWWQKFCQGKVEPDLEGDKPLCSYQFPLVFGVERIPDPVQDLFVPHGADSKHIVVVHKHRYYRVEMVRADGAVLSPEALLLEFERIRQDPRGPAPVEEDVGLLTAGDRGRYYQSRHQLIKTSPNVNGKSFKDIDTCLFVVALEDKLASSKVERTGLNLHGVSGANRWFDKHQLIIHPDGQIGMCMEHGSGDGMTWLRVLGEMYADVHGKPSPYSPLPSALAEAAIAPTRELDFTVNSDKSKKDMQVAVDFAAKLVADVDLAQVDFTEYGREQFKQWKVSPDSTMQMAFQLAYSRVDPSKPPPAVYEACAMKHFFHGRTETIRSCTSESQQMVQAFNDPKASAEAKRAALVVATKKHTDISKGARNCAGPNIGVDRHMLALRTAAGELGVKMPEVFTDANFAKGNTWNISTSNVTCDFMEAFAFGAVTHTGYGLGYMTTMKHLPFTVSSFKSGQTPKTSSAVMGQEIVQAIKDFEAVQVGGKP